MQTLVELSFSHGNAKGALFIRHKSLLVLVEKMKRPDTLSALGFDISAIDMPK
jgi:hypothetical protein